MPRANELQTFERQRLLCADYDGTIALTSETGPGIKNVDEAYAEAIDGLLGVECAQAFIDEGGHNHRTPAEIVGVLIPDATTTVVEQFANEITTTKLEILTDQIGKPLPDGATWPRFTDTFHWMWMTLNEDPAYTDTVDTAVLSAGHTSFIKKTFDDKELLQPGIIITDDVLVELGYDNLSAADRAKPNTPMLDLAETIWRGRNQLQATAINRAIDIIFVGDDPVKDRGLAENAGVAWLYLHPAQASEVWCNVARWATGLRVEAITYGRE